MIARLAFKYRVALTIFAMQVLVMGLMLALTLVLSFEALEQKQATRDQLFVIPLEELSRLALKTGQSADLQKYLSFVRGRQPGVEVVVTDTQGAVVASSDPAALSAGRTPPLADQRYWAVRDIEGEYGRLGRLGLRSSPTALEEGKRKALMLAALIAAAGIAVSAAVSLLMGHLLTRRLDELRAVARQFAAGQFDVRANLRGGDEVAELGRAFDDMAGALHEHLDDIMESEERFALAVTGTNDGIWDWDIRSGSAYYSPVFLSMLGYAQGEARGAAHIEFWIDHVHPDDREKVRSALSGYVSGESDQFVCEHRLRRKNGDYLWVLARGRGIKGPGGMPTRMAGSLTDVTERKRYEEAIEHQALHDSLTDLPNRALLDDRLGQALRAAHRDAESVAVVLLDLDRFKEINDALGHPVGDRVLKETARRLLEVLRDTDTLARFGGDEFVVVLPKAGSEEATTIVTKITGALRPVFSIDGHELHVEGSMGVTLFPRDGGDPDTLLKRADVAMYSAKAARTGYAFYDIQSDSSSPMRLAMVSELRHAVDEGGLVLHHQPKLDLATGSIYGTETLVRWQHPERGMVAPGEFIPTAESCGLIHPLTVYVLKTAIRQQRAWRWQGHDISVAVNVSTRMLQDLSLPDTIAALLTEWAVQASRLVLEITESAIMADQERARQVLMRLDAMGVQLSIDDFGTGYSSLAYLRRLPVDEVKIDRSFVMDMLHDPGSLAIVRSTIDLGHHLGLRVVAEGVESVAVLERLKALGCDAAQGYHISRPVPADEMPAFLDRAEGERARRPRLRY